MEQTFINILINNIYIFKYKKKDIYKIYYMKNLYKIHISL